MAEKRFIARRITESDKIRQLANEGRWLATTLYTFLLPYTDREGRLNANLYYLKGGIFQGYDLTLEELDGALRDLAYVGLVHLYSNGKHDRVIEYVKFHTSDGGFNKPHDREAASDLPGPDDPDSTPVLGHAEDHDPAETPPRTPPASSPVQGHGKVTDKVLDLAETAPRRSPEELKVERELELKTKQEIEHSSIAKREPSTNLAASPPRESHDPGLFAEVWNTNRGRLPAVHTLNAKRKGAIRALVKEHGAIAALDLFRDAVRAVATDEFWLTRQYGFDILLSGGKVLQRAEQWRAAGTALTPGNARLAQTAASIARAIGGLDDQPN